MLLRRRELTALSESVPVQAVAEEIGLRLTSPDALVIRRRRCGCGFVYVDDRGKRIVDRRTLQRIRSLAIPPAYVEVRIAADPDAHIQAIGQDEAGRTQYRYHPGWDEVREGRKIERLAELCSALPRIRRRAARDLQRPIPSRRKALAAVVTLIDRTHIRIGCEDYVHSGRSRGAATLLKRNVSREGDRLFLTFRGKGGRQIRCEVVERTLVEACEEFRRLPGPRLFQYRNGTGELRPVTAADANSYLQEISGATVSAKDFRTLAATAAAAERLLEFEPTGSRTVMRRQIGEVMRRISEMLGNTPAVARKSYVHRRLIDSYEKGELPELFRKRRRRHLSRGESAVFALFAHDSARSSKRKRSGSGIGSSSAVSESRPQR